MKYGTVLEEFPIRFIFIEKIKIGFYLRHDFNKSKCFEGILL